MKKAELVKIIREAIDEVLNEVGSKPAVAPSRPTTKPGVAPGKKPGKLGNPNVKPAPKASMNEDEKQILSKIVQRFKSKK